MSLRNIIPEKIHPNIWRNGMGEYDDIILFALSNYSPMLRSELISDEDTHRLNKNTFHGHAKELKRKGFIDSYKVGKKAYYKILPLGEIQLASNLHKYDLDFETRLKMEENKNKNLAIKFSKFFSKYELYHQEIQLEFLKLASVLTHEKLNIFTEEEFYELVLFLTLNHPRFYRDFSVSKEDFIKDITEMTGRILSENYIDTFIELVVDKELYGIGFHRLKIEETNKELFFAETSEYGELFKIIVDNRLKDLIFLKNLGFTVLNYQQLQRTYEEIIKFLIVESKLFHPDFKNSLYDLIENYRQTIKQQIIRRVPDELVEYTIFSLLPERKIVPKSVYSKENLKKINNIKLLIEIGKDQEVINEIRNLVSQDITDDVQEAIADLVIKLVNSEKEVLAKTIIEETTKIGKNISQIFNSSYESKVYDEMGKKNYHFALKLIENFENFTDDYKDYDIGILFNKIYALENLGRFSEAIEFIDFILENWEQFGMYVTSEVLTDYSEEMIDDEDSMKSYFYDFGILKAQILLKNGQNLSSLQVIDDIFNLDIETPVLYSLKAMNEISLDRYEAGLEAVEIGLKIDPKDPKLNQLKANILFKYHQYDEALDLVNYAIESDPNFSEDDSRKNLVLKAWILFNKNDLTSALDVVNKANEDFPNSPEILEIGSLIYDIKGKYEESLDYLGKAEKGGGKISLYNMAQLLKNIKKYDEALARINIAIKEDPKEALNYHLKAIVLVEKENFEEADKIIDKAIKLSPNDKEFKSDKEQILQRQALYFADNGKKERAISVIMKAIAVNTDWASYSYYIYGGVFIRFGEDYKGAIEQYEISKSLPFTPIETYLELGKCYMELDQFDLAQENLEIGIHEAKHRMTKKVLTDEGERIEKDFPQDDLIKKGESYLAELKSSLFYVFINEIILINNKKRFDVGFTHNLQEALENIKMTAPESVKSIRLKYFETFSKRADAKKRMLEVDILSRSEKELLIKTFDEA